MPAMSLKYPVGQGGVHTASPTKIDTNVRAFVSLFAELVCYTQNQNHLPVPTLHVELHKIGQFAAIFSGVEGEKQQEFHAQSVAAAARSVNFDKDSNLC